MGVRASGALSKPRICHRLRSLPPRLRRMWRRRWVVAKRAATSTSFSRLCNYALVHFAVRSAKCNQHTNHYLGRRPKRLHRPSSDNLIRRAERHNFESCKSFQHFIRHEHRRSLRCSHNCCHRNFHDHGSRQQWLVVPLRHARARGTSRQRRVPTAHRLRAYRRRRSL